MKARDLIARLQEVDGDTEVFRSHGAFSREVIDAEITMMCSHDPDGRPYWMRCQIDAADCESPERCEGVLIL
jgi:hypothetical protein